MSNQFAELSGDTNQAQGIAEYALGMVQGRYEGPSEAVLNKVEQFHLDSVACGVSALAAGANAPVVLRREALEYATGDGVAGVPMFGSRVRVQPEKAVLACSSAVREWDSNGTNFGYNPARGATAGEFGHNDFYPVVIAGAQLAGMNGRQALVAMATLDEIRGRLAEVFALNRYKVDHVVYGAIASAAVYGAMLGATAEQIESAIGLVVAHYIPFRAIRYGHQLSDSKGASAAISSEVAVLSMRRAMRGFVGPADVIRNPQAIFCLFEKTKAEENAHARGAGYASPFDLSLATSGDDFAVMGMHFKLGLYEHQSAGAIQGVIDLVDKEPRVLDDPEQLQGLRIKIYEPAFSIIGDPHKRDPRTRQSADHSMVYIVATLLRKAFESRQKGWDGKDGWRQLMLSPADYDEDETALFHPLTRRLMERIDFQHGGPEFDSKYPDGIPTTVELTHAKLGQQSSGLVMYPQGHARANADQLGSYLEYKFRLLTRGAVADVDALVKRFTNFSRMNSREIADLYDFSIQGVD